MQIVQQKGDRKRWKYLEPKVHIRNHHPLTAARMDPSSLSAQQFSTLPMQDQQHLGPPPVNSDDNGGLRENNQSTKGQCPLENLY